MAASRTNVIDFFDDPGRTSRRILEYEIWFTPDLKGAFTKCKSKANTGYKATFSVGDNASPTDYTQMAELASIKPSNFSISGD